MNQDEQNLVSQETNLEEAARKDGAAEVDANTTSNPSDPNSQDPQWQSKEAYEKRVQEFAFLPELNKKIHIALMVLIVSIAFLVLFLLTPLGSILPTYGGGGRQIPASPFVGVALLAAFTAYAVIVNSTKRISNIKGGKHKKIYILLIVIGGLTILNPLGGLILFFLIFCNLTPCIGT